MNANLARLWMVAVLLGGVTVGVLGQTPPDRPLPTAPPTTPEPPGPDITPAAPPEAPPDANSAAESSPANEVPAHSAVPAKSRSDTRATVARVALDIASGKDAWGQIVIELDEERAPLTVRNFLTCVDQGFYNNTIFHRVLRDYVAQAGGYFSLDLPKKSGRRPAIPNESDNQLKNLQYTVAMARGRDPASATSQFFINLADNPKLDYPGPDGSGYCVFGLVVSGQDVLERIATTEVQPNPQVPNENSRPVVAPLIRRAYRAPAEPAPGASQPVRGRPGGDVPRSIPRPSKPSPPVPAEPSPPVPPAAAEPQTPPADGER